MVGGEASEGEERAVAQSAVTKQIMLTLTLNLTEFDYFGDEKRTKRCCNCGAVR